MHQFGVILRPLLLRQVREKIEVAGREPRWEFNKTALFERSAHIADVCAHLLAALDTYHGLRQTLGPKLEAMTGNCQVSVTLQMLIRGSTALAQWIHTCTRLKRAQLAWQGLHA